MRKLWLKLALLAILSLRSVVGAEISPFPFAPWTVPRRIVRAQRKRSVILSVW